MKSENFKTQRNLSKNKKYETNKYDDDRTLWLGFAATDSPFADPKGESAGMY